MPASAAGIPTDTRGAVISRDHEVACNVSGEVALGRVLSVGTTLRRGRHGWSILVGLHHPCAGHVKGHVSRITNLRSIIVL